jgi:transcriptional regulator with XRE-family HTH domain
MARRRQDKAANAARGKRLAEIRDQLGITQDAMVPLLNAAAAELRVPATYRYYTVSRNESGTISFEDAAVWLSLDPLRRGWDWFVFGERAPAGQGTNHMDAPEHWERKAEPPRKRVRRSG